MNRRQLKIWYETTHQDYIVEDDVFLTTGYECGTKHGIFFGDAFDALNHPAVCGRLNHNADAIRRFVCAYEKGKIENNGR